MSPLWCLATLALRTVSIYCRHNYLLAEKNAQTKSWELCVFFFFFENYVLFRDLPENYSPGDRLSDSWL